MPDLEIVTIPNGQFAQNCYLLGSGETGETGEAVIVDPGEEGERFLREADRRGWRITEIWLTHAHIDHVLGVGTVVAATGAPIRLHPADRALYEAVPQQAAWVGLAAPVLPSPDHDLAAGDVLRVAGHSFAVRHTPGHAPGHVVFVGDGVVLAGDVLFAGSIGRTDLPGGDTDTLLASIARELLTLPDDTTVLPGHGPATTIGAERRTNPYLAGL